MLIRYSFVYTEYDVNPLLSLNKRKQRTSGQASGSADTERSAAIVSTSNNCFRIQDDVSKSPLDRDERRRLKKLRKDKLRQQQQLLTAETVGRQSPNTIDAAERIKHRHKHKCTGVGEETCKHRKHKKRRKHKKHHHRSVIGPVTTTLAAQLGRQNATGDDEMAAGNSNAQHQQSFCGNDDDDDDEEEEEEEEDDDEEEEEDEDEGDEFDEEDDEATTANKDKLKQLLTAHSDSIFDPNVKEESMMTEEDVASTTNDSSTSLYVSPINPKNNL